MIIRTLLYVDKLKGLNMSCMEFIRNKATDVSNENPNIKIISKMWPNATIEINIQHTYQAGKTMKSNKAISSFIQDIKTVGKIIRKDVTLIEDK